MKTEAQIRKEANAFAKELRKISKALNNLMDESETSAEGCTENQVKKGKADRLNGYATTIESSRRGVQHAIENLECIHYRMS